MKLFKRLVRGVARLPGVPQLRHVFEQMFAPFLRADVCSLHADHVALANRCLLLQQEVERLSSVVADISRSQPVVVNAIASTNGTARILQRSYDQLFDSVRLSLVALEARLDAIDGRSPVATGTPHESSSRHESCTETTASRPEL